MLGSVFSNPKEKTAKLSIEDTGFPAPLNSHHWLSIRLPTLKETALNKPESRLFIEVSYQLHDTQGNYG